MTKYQKLIPTSDCFVKLLQVPLQAWWLEDDELYVALQLSDDFNGPQRMFYAEVGYPKPTISLPYNVMLKYDLMKVEEV